LKLRSSGFEVKVARDAKSALIELEKGFVPDVILLDVVMPGIDGFEFLQMIRKKEIASNSIVIILSNLGQKDDIEKAKACGADDYIVKASFTPTEVVEKVKSLLEEKNKA